MKKLIALSMAALCVAASLAGCSSSSTSEESAAASEELSGQAQSLKQLVGQFELGQRNTDY